MNEDAAREHSAVPGQHKESREHKVTVQDMFRVLDARTENAEGSVNVVVQKIKVLALEPEQWCKHGVPGACKKSDSHKRDHHTNDGTPRHERRRDRK